MPTEVLETGRPRALRLRPPRAHGPVVCVFNFTDDWHALPENWVVQHGAKGLLDVLSDAPVGDGRGAIPLPPYARLWIRYALTRLDKRG